MSRRRCRGGCSRRRDPPIYVRVVEVGHGEVELAIPREITRHQRLRKESRLERHRRLERAIAVAQEDHDGFRRPVRQGQVELTIAREVPGDDIGVVIEKRVVAHQVRQPEANRRVLEGTVSKSR